MGRFDRYCYWLKAAEEDENVLSEHVKVIAFPSSRTILRDLMARRVVRQKGNFDMFAQNFFVEERTRRKFESGKERRELRLPR